MEIINAQGMTLGALEDQLKGVQAAIKARCETLAQPAREPQEEHQTLEALEALLARRREVLMSLGLAYARSRQLVTPDTSEVSEVSEASEQPAPRVAPAPRDEVIPARLAPARALGDPPEASGSGARILSRPEPASTRPTRPAPVERAPATPSPEAFDAAIWDDLITRLETLEPPSAEALHTLIGQVAERRALDHLLTSALDRLHLLQPENQVRFLELVQARVRAYQHHSGASHDEIHALHHKMRDYLEARRPGMAHGFALHHAPRHGDWLDDARHLRDALLDDLRAPAALLPEPDLSPAPRHADRARPTSHDAQDDAEGLPEGWPWLAYTQGKRALILGGARRPHTCRQYEQTFGFAEVEWWEEDAATYARVLQRVEGGTVDFIIITRFAGHDELYTLKEPCKARGVPRARLPQGYGAGALRAWIEENLTARPQPPQG